MISLSFFTHAKTYTVGVEAVNHFPHYDFTGAEPRGYLVDVINKFAKHQNIKIRFKIMSIDDLWHAYLNDKVDFRLPDNLLWQRDMKKDRDITYSVPIAYFTDGIISLSHNADKSLTKLGTIEGFTPWGYQDQIESGKIRLINENNLKNLINSLYAERFDGVYYNVEAFIKLIQEAGHSVDSVVFRKDLVKTRSIYMLSSIHHGKLIKELNQFLHSNKAWIRERKTYYNLK